MHRTRCVKHIEKEEKIMNDNDSLKNYMMNLEAFPRLTIKQENALAKRIASGDDAAKKELLECNLKLVVKIAHDYKGRGLSLADIISEGNLGLMRAVEKFNPAFGAKFSSYSAYWIKQSIQRAISKQTSLIRIPTQTNQKLYRVNQAKRELEAILKRTPTPEEIAARTRLSKRTVLTMLRIPQMSITSLAAPLRQGEDGSIQDVIPDVNSPCTQETVVNNENFECLSRFLNSLDDKERLVLTLRFGLNGNAPETLEQVAASIRKTRERVRQIQMDALKKLRELFNEAIPQMTTA